MSKEYPSNLTRAQYEFLSEMIPEAKPGGRKREVNMWEVLNAARRSEMAIAQALTCQFATWGLSCLANSVHIFPKLA
jgi:hypothetical protein